MKIIILDDKVVGTATDEYVGVEQTLPAPADFNVDKISEYVVVDGVVSIPAQTDDQRIEKLWQAAHDLEFANINGSAVGMVTLGLLQEKPKCIAVQSWISNIWQIYYERKVGGSTDLDFHTVCGDIPHSIPELMEELNYG